MRRLALTLATAVLASGCIIGDDDDDHLPAGVGSVTVYWDFVRNAPAQLDGFVIYDASLEGVGTGACVESAVEVVTVDVAGAPQFVVDCLFQGVQGATLDGLPAGTHTARVRGWRGSAVVYDSAVQLQVFPDRVTDAGRVDVEAVRAPLDLYGDLAAGPSLYDSCAQADVPDFEFQVWDSFGTLVEEGGAGCSDPLPAPVRVGNLDLDNYTVRMLGRATQGPFAGQVTFDSCDVAFDHFSAQLGELGVVATLFTPPSCQ